ncbi:MAG: hypothetical protein KGY66_02045 [Candidatus Thermoplasmatota archaeon]|nr:hypothetical protein [Candidatus Thermoplasmatota archaeon]MBS3789679.1 hypothetical protein [Candidatus Thermoplasmatota archaeon]
MPEGGRVQEIFIDGVSSRLENRDKYICPGCSEKITSKTKECPNCGLEFGKSYGHILKNRKNKIAAAIGTALFPGIGQLHNDQLEKSLIFLFLGVISHHYILNYISGSYIFLPIILIALLWAYFIYDAYSSVPNFAYQEGISPSNTEKSTIKAVLGSVVFPGIGQIYNGQYTKGAIMILVESIAFFYLHMTYYGFGILLEPLHALLFIAWLWAFNIYDAFMISKKINLLKGEILSLKETYRSG